MAYSVYALSDSARPDLVRYVGITKRGIARRASGHLSAAQTESRTHKRHWLRQVIRERRALHAKQLVSVGTEAEALKAERQWIALCLFWQMPLTNSCDGGRGLLNPTRGTRRKMSASHLGKRHSDETKARMRAAHLGRPYPKNRKSRVITEEFRARMAAVARSRRPPTEAQKARLRRLRLGIAHSVKTRAQMAASQRIRWSLLPDERRREIGLKMNGASAEERTEKSRRAALARWSQGGHCASY